MKKTSIIMCTAAVLAAGVGNVMAQDAHVWDDPRGWWDNHFIYGGTAEKFTAHEFSLDLFASYVAGERNLGDIFETNIRDGRWGGGVGANYFLTREIGIGLDANAPDNDGNFFDSVNASLIARFPIESASLAPYIFGGAGRQTEPNWEWSAHAGAGLEYRMNPITGIFLDGRYVWADENSDTLLLRTGLRLVF
jgi:hypothetical protein